MCYTAANVSESFAVVYTKSPLERRVFFYYYQVKCHQYWPEGEETLAFGSLDIICTKIRDFSPSYIYREMYVTDSKVSRKFVKKSNFSVNTAFLTSPLSAEFYSHRPSTLFYFSVAAKSSCGSVAVHCLARSW